MSDYSEFFLSSKSSIVQLELLDIEHPNFTQNYYIVRNAVNGVTVTLEDLSVQEYTYYPLRIVGIGNREDLDFGLRIDLGDLGEVLPTELDEIAEASGYGTKPVVRYRTYRSDDLSEPLFGPVLLEVKSFTFSREGASFEAKAPALNINTTGERFILERFPMLRGFL